MIERNYRNLSGGSVPRDSSDRSGPYDKFLSDWSRDGRYLCLYEGETVLIEAQARLLQPELATA